MLREDLDKKKLELSRGNAKHIGILTLSSSALPHPLLKYTYQLVCQIGSSNSPRGCCDKKQVTNEEGVNEVFFPGKSPQRNP